MAKQSAEIITVSDEEFTLLPEVDSVIDLSAAVAALGWTAPKVKTRDIVGLKFVVNAHKMVVNSDDETKWFYYCACQSIDDGNKFCTILGGEQIKDYLKMAWDYNPRARVVMRLGLTHSSRDREVYFIDAP